IGRDDMIDDPRFRANPDRVKHRDEVDAIVGGWIAERDQAEVLEIFGQAEVTASPIYDIEDIIADTHIRERGVIIDLPDADVEAVPMHNVTPRFSDTPGTFRHPAPGLGEHTGALLAELGIAPDRQVELKERGVI
ncbi:MAG: CoA transferase, partial [Alphaproteobacteria bacterium]